MKLTKRKFHATALALLSLGPLAAMPASAQAAYPNRPIKLVVPYPAGGASDAVARMLGEKLQQALGQPVVVDNRPGASGIIGAQAVIKSPPDGYTLLVHNTVLIQLPAVLEKPPFDPLKDLQPVVMTLQTNNLLVVPSTSPAKTFKEFLALAKANPAQYSYGSYGIGSGAHLHGELLKQQTGLDMAHVPFMGSAPMVTDLSGGHLPCAFIDIPSALPHLKSLRPLAVAGPQRLAELPEVPTFTELGYHSFDTVGWHGLFLPAGTPPAIGQKLAAEIGNILRMPELLAKFKAMGVSPGGGTPESFQQQLKNDAATYAKIAKSANIRVTQ